MKVDFEIKIEEREDRKDEIALSLNKNYGDCSGIGTGYDTIEDIIRCILDYLRRQSEADYSDLSDTKHRIPTRKNTLLTNSSSFQFVTLDYIFNKLNEKGTLTRWLK